MTPAMTTHVTEQDELDRYGIITVPMKVYTWGEFRYSNARDALAAAKRGASPASGE